MFFRYLNVFIPTFAYAMVFLFASILPTVEVPQLFGEKFHFNPQQLGLQFLAVLIGSVIGEQIGGVISDRWMNYKRKKIATSPEPEWRLWLSYLGFVLAIIGVIVFLVQLGNAKPLHWNITPLVGMAIGATGNQIVTTVMVTYAVDCYREEAASVGVFITFVRQIWGFLGPFWYVPTSNPSVITTSTDRPSRFVAMFDNLGLYGSAGLGAGLIFAFSLVPTIFLQWKGASWRN